MYLQPYCYHEPTLALRIGDVEYYAADEHGVMEFDGDLVLNLSGIPSLPSLAQMPSELAKYVQVPFKEVLIPCPDGGLPLVDLDFWKGLHEYVVSQGYQSVCVRCKAGHGRTGTFLAAVAIANLKWTANKAVKHLRYQVCRHMVETTEQCDFLLELDQELNGRKNKSIPDPSFAIVARQMEDDDESDGTGISDYEEMFIKDEPNDDEFNEVARKRKEE